MINNNILKKDIEKKFAEKKYDQVIEISDKFISSKERPPGLSNLLGTCKILKNNRTEQDLISGLDYYIEAYKNGKNTVHALSGLCNLITVSLENVRKNNELHNYISKAEKYYLESEKNFESSEKFLSIGSDLFEFLLNTKKENEILNKIIKSKNKSLLKRGRYLFFKNSFYDWTQKDFLNNTKNVTKFFSKFNVKRTNYTKKKKIKIGFVGRDFIEGHSITFFLRNFLNYLDFSKFEVNFFSFTRIIDHDPIQTKFKKKPFKWFDLDKLENQNNVNLIQGEKIDILIDLIGFTDAKKLEIFNSRIAPIQISWLSYLNTTGLDTIDYIFADKNQIPENEKNLYQEKIFYLPNIWNTHSGFDFKRKLINLPSSIKKEFTFGSLNSFSKINDDVINVWSQILNDIPNSRLLLKSSRYFDNSIIRDQFLKNNVSDKVTFLNRLDFLDINDHLNLYKEIDVALDTFPYNGVTTSFEAIWMGVPVLTMKGFNFNSRCGESINKNCGLDFFISKNKLDYIKKAIFLSKNKEFLIKERKKLYEIIPSSVLYDSKKFADNFSKSLMDIYNKKILR